MKFEFIIYIVIAFFQISFFWKTHKSINNFSCIFSDRKYTERKKEEDLNADDKEIQELFSDIFPKEKIEIPQALPGEFWVNTISNEVFEESDSFKYYRCVKNPDNEEEAYFYFLDDPIVKQKYFKNAEEMILPFAEQEEGTLNSEDFDGNYSITNLEPGILRCDSNGNWILKKKAKIKLSDHLDIVPAVAEAVNSQRKKIKEIINEYLAADSVATVPLGDIVDKTEEYLNTLEDDIVRTQGTPLYLGLIGTITGIVFGLFGYNGEGKGSIDTLIGSVRFAMILSGCGLFLYFLNSTTKFSNAKKNVEETKEKFYKFLRKSRKFRVMKDDFTLVLQKMQENLKTFNDGLGSHVAGLGSEYKKSAELIKKFDTKAWSELLSGIGRTVNDLKSFSDGLKNFNDSFKEVDKYLINIANVLSKILDFDKSIENIEKNAITTINQTSVIVGNLSQKVEDSSKTYLDKVTGILENTRNDINRKVDTFSIDAKNSLSDTHKNYADQTQVFIQKVAQTNDSVASTFNELAKNIKGISPEQWKDNIAVKQMDDLAESMAKDFEKIHKSISEWKEKIETTVKEDLKKEIKGSEGIEKSIEDLNKNINLQLAILRDIQENSKPRSFLMEIKDFFGIPRKKHYVLFDEESSL